MAASLRCSRAKLVSVPNTRSISASLGRCEHTPRPHCGETELKPSRRTRPQTRSPGPPWRIRRTAKTMGSHNIGRRPLVSKFHGDTNAAALVQNPFRGLTSFVRGASELLLRYPEYSTHAHRRRQVYKRDVWLQAGR